MKSSMKYIKLQGALKKYTNLGEFDSDNWALSDATFVDSDGDQIFFKWLGVPKRLLDLIEVDRSQTFFILRLKRKPNDPLIGMLFAFQGPLGNNTFYRDLAIAGLSKFGITQSLRLAFARQARGGSGILTMALIAGTLLSIFLGNGDFDSPGSFVGWGLGLIGLPLFFGWPYLAPQKRVGIDQMFAFLKENGFSITTDSGPSLAPNDKY